MTTNKNRMLIAPIYISNKIKVKNSTFKLKIIKQENTIKNTKLTIEYNEFLQKTIIVAKK